MKEEIEQLLVSLQEARKKCPWSQDREIFEHLEELENEVHEAKQAIINNDTANLKEELGDILMDLLFISVVAEEKKLFTLQEVITEVTEKLHRRKPWVFGSERVTNKEEASRRWNEIKAAEKNNKQANHE